MSAWIVSPAHIDVLVLASVQFGLIDQPTRERLTELGTTLWAENHRSVNYLYDEDEQPPPYVGPIAEVVLDQLAVVRAVDCYAYQSCEHPEWAASPTVQHCARLREAAMRGLDIEDEGPGTPYPVGYDEAPWGIAAIADACVSSTPPNRGVR